MSDLRPSRRADIVAVIALLATGVLFFADMLFAGRQLYLRDLTRYYYPTKQIVRQVLLDGELPLWNPYYSAGQPMAANPEYEVFYPPQWLILLPDYNLGYRLHIFVHVWIALLGMYAMLRSMRMGPFPAFFGAVVYGVGGLFLSMVNLLPILFCAAWIPLILLYARRLFFRFTWRDVSLGAFFAGMQILTAEPTTLVQTWVLIAVYGSYRAWYSTGPVRMLFRNGAVSALMLVFAIAIGGAQLIPAFEHAGESVRARPFEFSLVTSWSMPFSKPLELVFPNILGHIAVGNSMAYWGSGLYPNVGSPFIFNYYLGLLTIALLVGVLAAPPRGSLMVLGVVIFSFFVAFGGNTPLFRILYDAGIATSVRYPEKFAFMGIFVLIVFAAKTMQRVMEGESRILSAAAGFAAGTAVFATLVSIGTFTPLHATVFKKIWGQPERLLPRYLPIDQQDWIIAAVRGVLVFALLWFARKHAGRAKWQVLAGVLLIADLAPVVYQVNPRLPKSFFTEPPAARDVRSRLAGGRLFHEPDWYGRSETAQKYFSTGDGVYWVVRNGIYPMTPASWRIPTILERDYDKTALLPTVDLVAAMWKVRDAGRAEWSTIFMDMSDATLRASYRPFEAEKKRVGNRHTQWDPLEFKPHQPAGRFYFASDVQRIRGVDDFTTRLKTGAWEKRRAYVDHRSVARAGEGRVVRWTQGWNDARAEVEVSRGPALLVAAITPHRFWSATIDGKPASLEVVNVGYQGVMVPAGAREVVLRYDSPLVRWSLVVTVLATIMALLIAALSMIRPVRR